MTAEAPSDLSHNKKEHHVEVSDSMTEVNFRLDGPRVTVGFKCNKKLWDAFVPFCKANYGSVCHVLEPIIAALLTSRVNLSKTIKPLHIENLTVERAVRRVRRYAVEEEHVEIVKELKCAVCGRAAFAQAVDVEGSRLLCEADFRKVKGHLKGWKFLNAELHGG